MMSNPITVTSGERSFDGMIRPALVVFMALSVITGVIYPLLITGIAQIAFPGRANGSILTRDGSANGPVIGSLLIGQEFSPSGGIDVATSARYFWGRLSATGPVPYTAFNADKLTGSSGSNIGPTNPALVDNARARIEALNAADAAVGYVRPFGPGGNGARVPVDLATSSGSGLDPHLSLAGVEYQLPRVAKARGLSEDAVRDLIHKHTQGRVFGVLGEPVVNIVELNVELDRQQ